MGKMDGENGGNKQTINARAQDRKANFFARHMLKTWMIPILRKWSKWARDTATARILAVTKWLVLWHFLRVAQS